MKSSKDIQTDLAAALAATMDTPLMEFGFRRASQSGTYKRISGVSGQKLNFAIQTRPRYQPGADAHILPHVLWELKEVVDVALKMVEGNLDLINKTKPNSVIANLSLEWLTPDQKPGGWYASGYDEFVERCERIRPLVLRAAVPFFEEAQNPKDLVRVYETNDPRVYRFVSFVFVASAYLILGENAKAREVVQMHYSKPGLKVRYSVLFKSLGL